MISVCITTYNGEKYIKQQIGSILCQLGIADEIIVSDDNSTDRTLEIINSFEDTRIHIFNHTEINNPYSGYYRIIFAISRNVENALKYAKGDYIFLADQDDVWLPNRVKLSIERLQIYNLVISDCSMINRTGEVVKQSYFNEHIHPSKNVLRTFCKSSFHGCCMAFKKELKQDIIPFLNIPIGHDTWIGLVAIKKKYTIEFMRIPTVLYRLHNSNISVSETMNSKTSLWFKIKYRLNLIKAYINI
jgi:glycosyltransferase involved in cell wall biosynthesis